MRPVSTDYRVIKIFVTQFSDSFLCIISVEQIPVSYFTTHIFKVSNRLHFSNSRSYFKDLIGYRHKSEANYRLTVAAMFLFFIF